MIEDEEADGGLPPAPVYWAVPCLNVIV